MATTVDLPDPLDPTNAALLPASIVNDTSDSTRASGRDGYVKLTFLNSI